MRLITLIISLGYASDCFAADAWYKGFHHRKKLTIDNTLVSGAADLTNFTILVSYTDTDLRTEANGGDVENTSGYDIVFTDSHATAPTKLDHEVESYNATTGQIVMWVRIPTLDGDADTNIYIYYGNKAITTSQENITGTWESGHVMVMHLKESSGTVYDSTDHNNDTSAVGVGITYSQTGAIGQGLQSSGAATSFVTVPDSATIPGGNGTAFTAMSVGLWIYLPDTHTGSKRWFTKRSDSDTTLRSWQLFMTSATNNEPDFGIYKAPNDNSGYYDTVTPNTTTIANDTWTYLVGTHSTAATKIYIQGVERGSTANANSTVRARNQIVTFGNDLVGYVDEVRIYDDTRTADEIATEYNNQLPANQGTGAGKFIKTLSSEETRGPLKGALITINGR